MYRYRVVRALVRPPISANERTSGRHVTIPIPSIPIPNGIDRYWYWLVLVLMGIGIDEYWY